jgi:LmbE family N-acetylglucosaminyl deacetylase
MTKRVLGIYAHPDCPILGAGGAMAHWSAEGAEVRLLVCTRGEKGGDDPLTADDDVIAGRTQELEAAVGLLGISGLEFLTFPDGELRNVPALRSELVRRIRAFQPDVVLSHDPTAVFFGDSYVNHPDHRELGWAVLEAVSPGAASPRYYPHEGDPHRVSEVYLSGSLEPDAHIDVAAVLDKKIGALLQQQSQLGEDREWVDASVRARAAQAGQEAGLNAAESFRRLRLYET